MFENKRERELGYECDFACRPRTSSAAAARGGGFPAPAAVAGVQADVNQNEADCDAAVSAEEVRALAAESAITAARVAEEAARNQLNLHAGLAFGQLYVGDLIVA